MVIWFRRAWRAALKSGNNLQSDTAPSGNCAVRLLAFVSLAHVRPTHRVLVRGDGPGYPKSGAVVRAGATDRHPFTSDLRHNLATRNRTRADSSETLSTILLAGDLCRPMAGPVSGPQWPLINAIRGIPYDAD
jgi:hypothetical protein